MAEDALRIEIPNLGAVSGLWTEPEAEPTHWVFVYAPGAGSNLHDPFGAFLAPRLAERGVAALRFQFPYMEAGRPRPHHGGGRPWLLGAEEQRSLAPRRVASSIRGTGRLAGGLTRRTPRSMISRQKEGPSMRLQGIYHVGIPVNDIDRARTFY